MVFCRQTNTKDKILLVAKFQSLQQLVVNFVNNKYFAFGLLIYCVPITLNHQRFLGNKM